MPTTDFDWNDNAGFDLHLLRGSSYDLKDDLYVNDGTKRVPAKGPGLPPDLTKIEFTTDYPATLNTNGIAVDSATGVITVAAMTPPAPPLRNFLVHAAATHTNPAAVSPFEVTIRVHVHESVSSIRLTPATLTIHKGADKLQLTVLAKFDDAVVGDITRWTNLSWSSSSPIDIDVDGSTGALTANTVGSSATILASIPTLGGVHGTAVVNSKADWSTPQDVKFVAGKGAASRDDVRNVLFIPEGFTAAEKPKFQALVRGIHSRLATSIAMRPYDFLDHSMNYWMTFVESPEGGVSILPDASQFTRGPAKLARLVPEATKPDAAAATWSLEELIWEVGLPASIDDTPGRPLTGGPSPKLPDWQTLFGAGVTEAKVTDVYADWRALANHQPVNERNTAFGLAVGHRSCLRRRAPNRDLGLDYRRTTDTQLAAFVQHLTFSGSTIGVRWSTGGNDVKLVCFIARTFQDGGQSHDYGFAVSLDEQAEFFVATPSAGRPGMDIVPLTLEPDPRVSVIGTIAHELGHALGLGDEYGDGRGTRFPPQLDSDLDDTGNLEPRDKVSTAGALDGAKIKWLWPRIHHAGVTADVPIDEGGGVFRILLQPGHGVHFAKGDIVRLRLRDLVAHPALSDPLEVTDKAADEIKVKPVGGGDLDRSDLGQAQRPPRANAESGCGTGRVSTACRAEGCGLHLVK